MSLVATGSDGEDAKQYIITSESDTGSLDVTADAGTYKVLGGGYAYITDTAEEKVYYGNETISVPKAGVWAVSYADTLEDVINEVKAKFSVADVYDNGRGTISIEIPKYKHVMKITDAGLRESTGNFESNPNMEYLSENTELFGKTVRRIARNPEIGDEAAASCRPLIFKHSAILDENGNKIPVGDVRYITINYYFESPEENPSLEGLAMEWTQGRYLDSAGAGDYVGNTASSLDYAGEAPNTIKANSWSTVTIDMHTNSYFLSQYSSNPSYVLGQYKFKMMNAMMKQTEKLYIGDIIFTSYDPAEELKIPQMVFVSENGDDANDGSSIQKAVKTVGRAYEIAAECKNITFLVDGSVTQGEAVLEYPELTVVFASALNGKEAEITGGFTAVSNAVFENVGISGGLEDDGFELEFADSFTEADTIIIKSGKIQLIGGTADRIIITGENTEKSINISVDGTEINRLEFSGTSGVVTVGYYSGTINSVIAGSGAVTEHLQLLVGSGMTKPSGFDEVNVTGQKLTIVPPLMRASTGEYFKVNGTDSFGVFETFSGRTLNFGYGLTSYICYAYSSDGRKVYYSNSDTGYTLTLPESGEYQLYIAGEADYTAASGKNIKGFSTSMLKLPAGATGWTDDNNGAISAVMSAESQLYINDGYVLNVYADGQVFDIASLEHAQPEGRVFLGWSLDESGNNYPTDNEITLNSGDKLYTQFAESKFDIIGAQIRLTGEQGLRFITETNDSFINEVLSSADYGSVVFVTKYLGGDELILDTEYSYGNKTYASKSVKAEKLFSYDENTGTIQYTACIIDILPENYIREYTVRPYARYTDKNGNSRVYYGDQYSTGVFAVANYALRTDYSLSAEDKEVFEEINSIGLAAKEAPIAYTSGSSSSTEEDYRQGKVIYTTESGVKVCEIHVPAKGTASSGAEIAVVTDTHINVVDDNDMYDAEVQYTNQTRAWCRGGATVPGTEKAIEFASMYDQMVVTGDIIDYLSLGALETVKRIAFDPYPEGMYVLGGHDVTKNMETGYADQLSLEQRQEILRQYWPNDMFYTSRVINGSVMCIQLDNGCSQYWDSQVALIENDLNTARENGYTVLIFQHEPLGTGNPEDTAVPSLCPDADSAKVTYNFYGSAHIGGNGKNDTAASKAVYELITNNGDIIGGIFAGHRHYRYYTEILAKTADGEDCVIPQYVLRSCAYETNGFVTKIVFGQE